MNSANLPNDSYLRKTRARSYFYEIPCWNSLFNISNENFNLKKNHFPGIKFAECCRAGGK